MANETNNEVVEVIVEEIKEEAAEMANDVRKVVEVEEDKVKFPIRGFLKYLGVGLLGASAGVVGKVIYDDRKTKRDSKLYDLQARSAEAEQSIRNMVDESSEF